jgi:hypothetical protein
MRIKKEGDKMTRIARKKVWAVFLLALAGATALSGSSASAAEISQKDGIHLSVYTGIFVAWKLSGELPGSLDSLCASAYMPIRCSDLGIGTAEEAKRVFGTLQWDVAYSPPRVSLRYRGGLLSEGALTVSVPAKERVQEDLHRLIPGLTAGSQRKLTSEEAAAYAVFTVLRGRLIDWLVSCGRLPDAIAPALGSHVLQTTNHVSVQTYAWPHHLFRNDFTGGYAREVASPSAGDYALVTDADGSQFLVVYGSDRAPLFKYRFRKSTQARKNPLPDFCSSSSLAALPSQASDSTSLLH